MHAAEREEVILHLLQNHGFVSFQELERQIDASPATIRRDLERLENDAKIVRVRGGAHATDGVQKGPSPLRLTGIPFHVNVNKNRSAKAAIGKSAASLCRPGESIIIDGGSTTLQMCPHIESLGLQVLTNSLYIVSALLSQANTRLSLPSGTLFREQNIILSPFEDDGMDRYHACRMFMGAESVGRHGVMQSDVILIQAERRFMKRADELVLLVDSSKFEAPAGQAVCDLEEIDILVTDENLSDRHAKLLEDLGVKIAIAGS